LCLNPRRGLSQEPDRGRKTNRYLYRDIFLPRRRAEIRTNGRAIWQNRLTSTASYAWRTVFQTRAEASASIAGYIESFYNPVRRDSALDFVSPIQFVNALA
jgi:putative transposase